MTLDGAVSMGRVSQRPVPKFHQQEDTVENYVEIIFAVIGLISLGVSATAVLLFTLLGA